MGYQRALASWLVGCLAKGTIFCSVMATLCLAGIVQGAERSQQALLDAYLAAGEFAPALKLANAAADAQQKDAWLAQISQAQASAGAYRAAQFTASEIADDRNRSTALKYSSRGARGGAQADFDSLIELMTSTIAPTTWDEVGGPGSVREFAAGIYVDARGLVRPLVQVDRSGSLIGLHAEAKEPAAAGDARKASALRKVSLPRLEKQVQLRLARGEQPTEEMLVLAGLQKIKYVLVYPESRDLVLVGPASDWRKDGEGRLVGRDSGRPVLQLDDLVVIWRQLASAADARFGCSITPTQENLAKTHAFLEQSGKSPLKPGQRDAWLKQLRDTLGQQTIDVYGIDPGTRVGQVLVEADYRMKLVGMGLEEGTLGVESYLKLIQLKPGEAAPPMDVLRWWFTMNYDAIVASPDRNVFEIRGQGVQVLSENEMLTKLGERVHTGQSEPLNQEFALSFTKNFAALAAKYPIYAELQNLFDLALVAALVEAERLDDQAQWRLTCFGDPAEYQAPVGVAPKTVETVINHRVIQQKTILAGVSGGVRVDPWKYVERGAVQTDTYGKLKAGYSASAPKNLARDAWWWD